MNVKLNQLRKIMTNYLELAQLPDGSIVLRRSDDKENPIVKIEFSKESKDFLRGQELDVAKEMIRAGIESVSGNVSDLDEFFEKQRDKFSKKQTIVH
jgi:hypothetical protein|tara:strand:- start:117 stop:407 length:291 start_codon:yes stop_codon:yes gene_type:complete